MSDPSYEAISKAKRQTESGNPQGAVKTLEDYLYTDPTDIKARLQLAQIAFYSLNDANYGMVQLDAILDIDPDNIEAMKAACTVLVKNKKFNSEVDGYYQKLIVLSPQADVFDAYAVFLRLQMTDFKKAAVFHEKAIELSPEDYRYHQNYAVLLLNDLRDYEKGKTELEEVLRLKPDHTSARANYEKLMKKKFDASGNPKKKGFSLRKK